MTTRSGPSREYGGEGYRYNPISGIYDPLPQQPPGKKKHYIRRFVIVLVLGLGVLVAVTVVKNHLTGGTSSATGVLSADGYTVIDSYREAKIISTFGQASGVVSAADGINASGRGESVIVLTPAAAAQADGGSGFVQALVNIDASGLFTMSGDIIRIPEQIP